MAKTATVGGRKPAGAAGAAAKKAGLVSKNSAAKKKKSGSHYRKGQGKVHEDDDDEDDMSEIEEVAMSDSDVDMEDSLVPRKRPIQSMDLDDLMGEALEEEEEFIAHANIAANKKHKKSGGFQSMGLSFPVYKAILHKGFKVPTPIQRKCIPLVMEGGDVVGMARTGSGKTAAFLIPMLEKLKAHSAKVGARAIVLSPSRELAMQTQKVCKELGKYTDLRSCILVGGDSLEDQFSMLAANPDILIATPGRLLHLIVEMELDLRSVQYIVFDEADRLFEMGFEVQLHEILHRLPPNRQTLLFSATLPKMLVDFAKAGLQEPTLVRLDVDTKISKDLEMAFFNVKQQEKEAALLTVLRNVIKLPMETGVKYDPKEGSGGHDKKRKKSRPSKDEIGAATEHQTIVFVSTKHHVEYVANILITAGYQVSYIYGSLDQTARKIQIDRFRKGYTNLLVVTDVAARGIDIPVLENVINYDFVDNSKVFIHRVGRTARAGKKGVAYSFVSPEELPYLIDLQLFLARKMIVGSATAESGQEPDYTADIVLGCLPLSYMELHNEWVKSHVLEDHNLNALRGVSLNGYKLYCRSRPSAAPESYKRAKEIVDMNEYAELHSLFSDMVNDEEKARVNLLASISNFRPVETIFEFGQRGVKGQTVASNVMKARRGVADKVIHKARQLKAGLSVNLFPSDEAAAEAEAIARGEKVATGPDATEDELASVFKTNMGGKNGGHGSGNHNGKKKEKPTSFRDEAFYMSHTQQDSNTERGYSMVNDRASGSSSFLEQAQRATMDMQGDERETMARAKNSIKWDAKKKKFVRGGGVGADNKKLITTESGNKISASFKSGRFQEWQQRTKTALPRTGEMELSSGKAALAAKRYRHAKITEAKPLDPLAMDYERKLKKRKMGEDKDAMPPSSAASGASAFGKKGAGGKKGKAVPARGTVTRGGKNVRSELKSSTAIAKERLAKEQRREKTGRHAGSKFAGKGGRGGGKGGRGGRGGRGGGGRGGRR